MPELCKRLFFSLFALLRLSSGHETTLKFNCLFVCFGGNLQKDPAKMILNQLSGAKSFTSFLLPKSGVFLLEDILLGRKAHRYALKTDVGLKNLQDDRKLSVINWSQLNAISLQLEAFTNLR